MEIIEYERAYREDFKRLNVEWIEMHWELEESDYLALDNPEAHIIARGGQILLAMEEGKVAGTCALIRITNTEYELAKMAVDAKIRGKGIGAALGAAAIETARSLNAEKLFLETNTILEPAIRLYRKLGFVEIAGKPSPYNRCNIQMVLDL